MKTFSQWTEEMEPKLQANGPIGNGIVPGTVRQSANRAFEKIGDASPSFTTQRRRTLLANAISSLGYTDVKILLKDMRAVAKELQIPGAENEQGDGKPPLGVVTAPNTTQSTFTPPVQ